ncbi:hypothetical protein L3Q82_024322 [Scortum barcoo]|uniref:Uncharacterized protein n=1 Tax=Scortum barcoo TaxID=214431 RepID=A0ACB8WW84_9TELE|nr:hypothetical protein L3Q82_024322 [Scortum barcoo]
MPAIVGECVLTVHLDDDDVCCADGEEEGEEEMEFYLLFSGSTQRHLTSTLQVSHVTLQAVCPDESWRIINNVTCLKLPQAIRLSYVWRNNLSVCVCVAHNVCEQVLVTLCLARRGGPVDTHSQETFCYVQDLALDMAHFLLDNTAPQEALLLDDKQIPLKECEKLDQSLALALKHLTLPHQRTVSGKVSHTDVDRQIGTQTQKDSHIHSDMDNNTETHKEAWMDVSTLLDSCPVMSQCQQLSSLLHLAASHGLRTVASFLLQQPGSREALRRPNTQGLTPARLAESRGHQQLVELFTQHETSSNVQVESKEHFYPEGRVFRHHENLSTYTLTFPSLHQTEGGAEAQSSEDCCLQEEVKELRRLIHLHREKKGNSEFASTSPSTDEELASPACELQLCSNGGRKDAVLAVVTIENSSTAAEELRGPRPLEQGTQGEHSAVVTHTSCTSGSLHQSQEAGGEQKGTTAANSPAGRSRKNKKRTTKTTRRAAESPGNNRSTPEAGRGTAQGPTKTTGNRTKTAETSPREQTVASVIGDGGVTKTECSPKTEETPIPIKPVSEPGSDGKGAGRKAVALPTTTIVEKQEGEKREVDLLMFERVAETETVTEKSLLAKDATCNSALGPAAEITVTMGQEQSQDPQERQSDPEEPSQPTSKSSDIERKPRRGLWWDGVSETVAKTVWYQDGNLEPGANEDWNRKEVNSQSVCSAQLLEQGLSSHQLSAAPTQPHAAGTQPVQSHGPGAQRREVHGSQREEEVGPDWKEGGVEGDREEVSQKETTYSRKSSETADIEEEGEKQGSEEKGAKGRKKRRKKKGKRGGADAKLSSSSSIESQSQIETQTQTEQVTNVTTRSETESEAKVKTGRAHVQSPSASEPTRREEADKDAMHLPSQTEGQSRDAHGPECNVTNLDASYTPEFNPTEHGRTDLSDAPPSQILETEDESVNIHGPDDFNPRSTVTAVELGEMDIRVADVEAITTVQPTGNEVLDRTKLELNGLGSLVQQTVDNVEDLTFAGKAVASVDRTEAGGLPLEGSVNVSPLQIREGRAEATQREYLEHCLASEILRDQQHKEEKRHELWVGEEEADREKEQNCNEDLVATAVAVVTVAIASALASIELSQQLALMNKENCQLAAVSPAEAEQTHAESCDQFNSKEQVNAGKLEEPVSVTLQCNTETEELPAAEQSVNQQANLDLSADSLSPLDNEAIQKETTQNKLPTCSPSKEENTLRANMKTLSEANEAITTEVQTGFKLHEESQFSCPVVDTGQHPEACDTLCLDSEERPRLEEHRDHRDQSICEKEEDKRPSDSHFQHNQTHDRDDSHPAEFIFAEGEEGIQAHQQDSSECRAEGSAESCEQGFTDITDSFQAKEHDRDPKLDGQGKIPCEGEIPTLPLSCGSALPVTPHDLTPMAYPSPEETSAPVNVETGEYQSSQSLADMKLVPAIPLDAGTFQSKGPESVAMDNEDGVLEELDKDSHTLDAVDGWKERERNKIKSEEEAGNKTITAEDTSQTEAETFRAAKSERRDSDSTPTLKSTLGFRRNNAWVFVPVVEHWTSSTLPLCRVLEGLWEFAQPVHMCFVDLEKAFDRVPRGILWGVLREYGVRGPFLRAVRSLYDWSRSLVRIAGSKSDLFPVHVGLRQGCPLSPVLFIIFMDRISRRSQGPEGVRFGNHRISSLLFADDVVLLASSSQDLQHVLERFAAECEAAGMRISTSKSEAMVLAAGKGWRALFRWVERSCLRWRSSSISGSCSRVRQTMEREIDRRIGAASAVMRSVYRTVVVKKELSRKAKLSLDLRTGQSHVPTLTYGHELWVMTERTRSRWIQAEAAEMSFLRRVAGHSLRDRVRSSVTREELESRARCSFIASREESAEIQRERDIFYPVQPCPEASTVTTCTDVHPDRDECVSVCLLHSDKDSMKGGAEEDSVFKRGGGGEEEEKKDQLLEDPVSSAILRASIRSLSPFRRHSWEPGRNNAAADNDITQRSSLKSLSGEAKRAKPPLHRRSYSLEGLEVDRGAAQAQCPGLSDQDKRTAGRSSRLESQERGSLVSLTEEEQEGRRKQHRQPGVCVLGGFLRSKRRISFSLSISPLRPKNRHFFTIGSSSSDEEEGGSKYNEWVNSCSANSGSLEYSISEEEPGPLRSDTEGKGGPKISRTFSYLRSKMSKKGKEKEKERRGEKERESKDREKKSANGHLFLPVIPSPSTACQHCTKLLHKETFLCNTTSSASSISSTSSSSSRERWSTTTTAEDQLPVVFPRRHPSIFNSHSNLAKSISTSNIAGLDDVPLKGLKFLSQSTDSLNQGSKVNASTESLTDEGTEMMDSQLMGEFECDIKDLEADSWSSTVDKKFLKTLKKDEIKRQDVIYELYQTEFHHVRTLKIMSEVYYKGLLKELQLDTHTLDKIFPVLDDLLDTHTHFLTLLLERKRASSAQGQNNNNFLIYSIGDILVNQFSGYSADRMKKVYGKFCSRHNEAVSLYKDLLAKDKRFQAFIKRIMSSSIVRRLGIPECILLVTQRITKYPVLIQRILQHTKDSEEDHSCVCEALRCVKELITAVDSKVNEQEKKQRLREVYSRTDSKSIMRMKSGQMFAKEDLIRGRKLLHDGALQLKNSAGRLKDVHAMLLSDVLVFLQEKDQKYVFASLDQRSTVISLQNLIVREVANEERGLFLITAGIERPEMVEVLASSKDERNTWRAIIQDAMHCMEKDEDEGVPSETEEDRRQQENRAKEIRELLRRKDEEILSLLEEKVHIFRDLSDCNPSPDDTNPPFRERMLFRATPDDVTKGEPIIKDALREVETLHALVNSGIGGAGCSVPVGLTGGSVGPVCLPRRAETFGGFDSHQMNSGKNGEKEEGDESLDLRRTESDSVLKKGVTASLQMLLKRNNEFINPYLYIIHALPTTVTKVILSVSFNALFLQQVQHSVTTLHQLLISLQAVVVQQDSFIEDQRQAMNDRLTANSSRHSSSSSLSSSSSSRPSSLIEQEKHRSLERQRQEAASLQKQQAAHQDERRRREKVWELKEKALAEREERLRVEEEETSRRRQELTEEREMLQRKKEEYQRELERLREAQRRLERDKEALRRDTERLEAMKRDESEQLQKYQRTPSTTSEDSIRFHSSGSLDLDSKDAAEQPNEVELSSSAPPKEPFLRIGSKRMGKNFNPFSSSSSKLQGAEKESQLPTRLLQLAKPKEKKEKKKKKGKGEQTQTESKVTSDPQNDGDIFFC